MPSVADELAALRARSVTKQHAASLESKSAETGSALSTPEAEEAALKAKKECERVGNYSKDAEANLKAGVKDVGLEDEFRMKVGDKKREDVSKKIEAEKNLKEFNFKGELSSLGMVAPDAVTTEPPACTHAAPPPEAPSNAAEDDDDKNDIKCCDEKREDMSKNIEAERNLNKLNTKGELSPRGMVVPDAVTTEPPAATYTAPPPEAPSNAAEDDDDKDDIKCCVCSFLRPLQTTAARDILSP